MPDQNSYLENRISAFERPKTKREIVRGRKQIHVDSFTDIVPALENRKNNEVLMIGPSVDIIPRDESGIPQYYSAQNFSKRGPLVRLQTFNKNQSIDKKWSPVKARIDASKRHKFSDKRWAGWFWRDPENVAHTVQPWMVVEGRRIEMFGHLTGFPEDKVEITKTYRAKDSNLISIWTKVPSRSSELKHDVVMHNLTSLLDPSRHFEWPRFYTEHSCAFKRGAFSFRFPRANNYCMHEISSHAGYSRTVGEKSGLIILQPAPMVTEPMVRLYLSSIYDTMKIDPTPSGRGKSRPLSVFEINPILMDAWLRYGNKKTFWVSTPSKGHKKMSEYDWQNSAPGMEF